MSKISKTDATYVMGHPKGEEERLHKLGQLLYPSTRHLFEQAGITADMKVLDVGSGAGDVALLLAELVGPEGAIVGVEIHPAVLDAARVRVQAAGLTNITFIDGDIRKVALDDDFDAIVGRNILMYTSDPAEVLRICSNHLRPGGVVAFQEIEWSITEQMFSMPTITPLVQQMATWMIGGFRQAKVEMQIGFKFPKIFLDANLPLPQISLDGIIGTEADWVGYDFITDALRDILPKLREYSILTEDLEAASYVTQMREEIIQQHSLFPMFFMVGAWTQKL